MMVVMLSSISRSVYVSRNWQKRFGNNFPGDQWMLLTKRHLGNGCNHSTTHGNCSCLLEDGTTINLVGCCQGKTDYRAQSSHSAIVWQTFTKAEHWFRLLKWSIKWYFCIKLHVLVTFHTVCVPYNPFLLYKLFHVLHFLENGKLKKA